MGDESKARCGRCFQYRAEAEVLQRERDEAKRDTARLDWIAEAMPREDRRDLRTIIDEQIAVSES